MEIREGGREGRGMDGGEKGSAERAKRGKERAVKRGQRCPQGTHIKESSERQMAETKQEAKSVLAEV